MKVDVDRLLEEMGSARRLIEESNQEIKVSSPRPANNVRFKLCGIKISSFGFNSALYIHVKCLSLEVSR